MAVAALVLGILAAVLCWVPFVNWILAALAVIFGAVGFVKGKRVGRGKPLAITGLILGVVAIGVSLYLVSLLNKAAREELEGLKGLHSARVTHVAPRV